MAEVQRDLPRLRGTADMRGSEGAVRVAVIASRRRTGPVIPAGAPLHCAALHPDGGRREEYARQVHHTRLPATLPVAVRHTRRILEDYEEVRPGSYGIRCSCGAVNEFEPVEVDDG